MVEFGNFNFVVLLAILALTAIVPFMVIALTSFAKIAVVLFIIRNALGIQQTPPNMIMYGLALIMSAYIMAPVIFQIYDIATDPRANFESIAGWTNIIEQAAEPIRNFLDRHAMERERVFFIEAADRVWGDQIEYRPTATDFMVLIPSFLSSELSRAFEIGFLLYLPFLMIDFAVSALLIALGMQMMAPNIISTPLKLLLFVMVDGWARLLEGLILSYA